MTDFHACFETAAARPQHDEDGWAAKLFVVVRSDPKGRVSNHARLCAGLICLALLAACGRPAAQAPPPAPVPAEAPMPPALKGAASAAHKAADRFVAMAAGSDVSGAPPRASDRTAGRLLDVVFDMSAVPVSPPAREDFGQANDWLLSMARVGSVYLYAGGGPRGPDGEPTQAAFARSDENLKTFEPELARYLDGHAALVKVEADAVLAYIADPEFLKNPDYAKGVDVVRGDVLAFTRSLMSLLPNPRLSDDWRRARMAALLPLAASAARLLRAAEKAELAAIANQVAGDMPDPGVQADLRRIAGLMSAQGPAQTPPPPRPGL